ncbi:hypothetical protein TNCV_3800171 [Trichonephila clavipes]|nr:hypothetical protein TNCV_3800171 [Trichonephila clavipes]
MPKFEGPYRVLEVRNNNLIIWKKEEGSQLILTKCECTIQDSPTQLVLIVIMRLYMKERGLVMGRVSRTRENPKALGKPRVMRGSPLNPRLHEVSVGPTLCFGSCLKPRMPQSPLSHVDSRLTPVHVDSRLTPVPRRFPFDTCPTSIPV